MLNILVIASRMPTGVQLAKGMLNEDQRIMMIEPTSVNTNVSGQFECDDNGLTCSVDGLNVRSASRTITHLTLINRPEVALNFFAHPRFTSSGSVIMNSYIARPKRSTVESACILMG